MEKQGAKAGTDQRNLYAQAGDDRHQNGSAEHGEHVLDAQNQHFSRTQFSCVANGLGRGGGLFAHFISSLFVFIAAAHRPRSRPEAPDDDTSFTVIFAKTQ